MDFVIPPYRIFSLGDAAITIDFGNAINETINRQVLHLFDQLQNKPLPGMIEAVPAYSSLTVYYNVAAVSKRPGGHATAFDFMSVQLTELLRHALPEASPSTRLINIPVCYEKEFAPDIGLMAREKKISVDELIRMHTAHEYRVYMLGFQPGFGYMGEVDGAIAMPRKRHPVTVAAGSVGIAGRQTGVYPMACPGGWHIIGRTPLKLFDAKKDEPALLRAGDKVRFIAISKNEFENY